MNEWYALWTRSRQEGLACRELTDRHIEAFLPTVSRWSAWTDRKKKIQWPLFPGYCFARFDSDARHRVLNCDGVAGIVSFGGTPAPIDDVEIDGIRRLLASNVPFDPCPLVREGMRVQVVKGPLTGIIGRLVRKASHEELVLAVELVNGAVSVQVDARHVVAV